MEEAWTRADGVLERLDASGGDVLLFGHGHFSRVLGARLVGLPASDGGLLMLGPASISIVGFEHGQRAIRTWNSYSARMS
jgi:probable phosphoglycerate mutase